jgi:hypothetical protein
LLSTIGKLADKSFVLGFLLPSFIAIVAIRSLVGCPPWISGACVLLPSGNAFADVTYLLITVWAFAVFLLALNNGVYRFYEGYTPPLAWFGFLKHFQRYKHRRLTNRYNEQRGRGESHAASLTKVKLLARFPQNDSDILPTAFGNRIRAFEFYPKTVYGGDSISLWPRLLTVIPSDYLAQLADARSVVDFAINTSLVCLIMASLLAARSVEMLLNIYDPSYTLTTAQSILVTVILAALSHLTYLLAANRSSLWGEFIKASFDCYLGTLATQLGYVLPESDADRREFWKRFSKRALYMRAPGAEEDRGGLSDD